VPLQCRKDKTQAYFKRYNTLVNRTHFYPIFQAILAAILFGASAPISKLFLGDINPITLAGLLYLGCGFGLFIIRFFKNITHKIDIAEAKINKKDFGWLFGAIIAGGVAAPIVLLFGLRDTPGSTASLLLNFEGVATTLIAALAFKEHVSKRTWLSIILITSASILLTMNITGEWGFSFGALGIILACVLWGIDNNFTRNISSKNPTSIVMIKGLIAGSFSSILALMLGNKLPPIGVILLVLLLGYLSYGVSITLFIRAMRGLGASRASTLFGTSPLAGIALSIVLLRESPNLWFLAALLLMVAGTLFVLFENHSHKHLHFAIIHEHAHHHDEGHHSHRHNKSVRNHKSQSHSHIHEHIEIEHEHEHMPDINHRHNHNN